jgi:hypothetical protein
MVIVTGLAGGALVLGESVDGWPVEGPPLEVDDPAGEVVGDVDVDGVAVGWPALEPSVVQLQADSISAPVAMAAQAAAHRFMHPHPIRSARPTRPASLPWHTSAPA